MITLAQGAQAPSSFFGGRSPLRRDTEWEPGHTMKYRLWDYGPEPRKLPNFALSFLQMEMERSCGARKSVGWDTHTAGNGSIMRGAGDSAREGGNPSRRGFHASSKRV